MFFAQNFNNLQIFSICSSDFAAAAAVDDVVDDVVMAAAPSTKSPLKQKRTGSPFVRRPAGVGGARGGVQQQHQPQHRRQQLRLLRRVGRAYKNV